MFKTLSRPAIMLAVVSLAGCGLTPTQQKVAGIVAGVLIVGAIVAHNDNSQPEVATRQPQCLPNNPRHACQ